MQSTAWFAGKDFTSDWTSHAIVTFPRILGGLSKRELQVLEVGSWEGRSAILLLELLPLCRLTCIDTFKGPLAYQSGDEAHAEAARNAERRFDHNLAAYGDRVEKIKDRSFPALDRLGVLGRKFDVIYIDGSHMRDDVLADSLLAWPLLKSGGLLIWDDYLWRSDEFSSDARPQEAIDLFLTLHAGDLTVIEHGQQVAAKRR